MACLSHRMIAPNNPFEALAAFFADQAALDPEHVSLERIPASKHTDDPCWRWRVTDTAPRLVDSSVRTYVQDENGRVRDAGDLPLLSGVVIDWSEGWLVAACSDDEGEEDMIEIALANGERLLQSGG